MIYVLAYRLSDATASRNTLKWATCVGPYHLQYCMYWKHINIAI